jgi:predicted small secreted protein
MKQNLKSFIIALFATALFVVTGTGCKSTAHGAGQDIERMGEKIQKKTD